MRTMKNKLEEYEDHLAQIYEIDQIDKMMHLISSRVRAGKMSLEQLNVQIDLMRELAKLNNSSLAKKAIPFDYDGLENKSVLSSEASSRMQQLPNVVRDFTSASKDYAATLLETKGISVASVKNLTSALRSMNEFSASVSAGSVKVGDMAKATKGLTSSLATQVKYHFGEAVRTENTEGDRRRRDSAFNFLKSYTAIVGTAMLVTGLCLTLTGFGAAIGAPMMGLGIGMTVGNLINTAGKAIYDKHKDNQIKPIVKQLDLCSNLLDKTAAVQKTLSISDSSHFTPAKGNIANQGNTETVQVRHHFLHQTRK